MGEEPAPLVQMGEWTHRMCDLCWSFRSPGRVPVRVGQTPAKRPAGKCCACGAETRSGIYVREDPKAMLCDGDHAS